MDCKVRIIYLYLFDTYIKPKERLNKYAESLFFRLRLLIRYSPFSYILFITFLHMAELFFAARGKYVSKSTSLPCFKGTSDKDLNIK